MTSTVLNDQERKAIAKEIAKYPKDQRQAAVIAALHIVQDSRRGWLKPEALEAVASELEMPLARVHEVASFYSLYFLKDCGRLQVDLCTNVSCMLKGAGQVLEALKHELSDQKELNLREVECLGACVHAPVMQIKDQYYENLDAERAVSCVRRERQALKESP